MFTYPFIHKFMYIMYQIAFLPSCTSPDNCPVNFLGRSSSLFYRTIHGQYVSFPRTIVRYFSNDQKLLTVETLRKKFAVTTSKTFPGQLSGDNYTYNVVRILQRLGPPERNLSFQLAQENIDVALLRHPTASCSSERTIINIVHAQLHK